MQMLADVLELPVMVNTKDEICARGAAIYASVASRIYADIPAAQKVFCEEYRADYVPDKEAVMCYKQAFKKYKGLAAYMDSGYHS